MISYNSEQSILDRYYMSVALDLAKKGVYTTHPNPQVGCIVVLNGKIVGKGWHIRKGDQHAEAYALSMAGSRAHGATVYVTLEPCNHYGNTPPCTEYLIQAGVARIVISSKDPNPEVSGRGILRLKMAGIEVVLGVGKSKATLLNRGFFKRMREGVPFVKAKIAISLDGRTAMMNGESKWITGPMARSKGQRLRAESSMILTGADTLIADESRFTVRRSELGLNSEKTNLAMSRLPLRMVIDGPLRLDHSLPFFKEGPCLVATYTSPPLPSTGDLEYLEIPKKNNHINLEILLSTLASRGVNDILLESGPQLISAFTEQKLIDEYHIFIAPKFLGSISRSLIELPIFNLSEAVKLKITGSFMLAGDLQIIAIPIVTS